MFFRTVFTVFLMSPAALVAEGLETHFQSPTATVASSLEALKARQPDQASDTNLLGLSAIKPQRAAPKRTAASNAQSQPVGKKHSILSKY